MGSLLHEFVFGPVWVTPPTASTCDIHYIGCGIDLLVVRGLFSCLSLIISGDICRHWVAMQHDSSLQWHEALSTERFLRESEDEREAQRWETKVYPSCSMHMRVSVVCAWVCVCVYVCVSWAWLICPWFVLRRGQIEPECRLRLIVVAN